MLPILLGASVGQTGKLRPAMIRSVCHLFPRPPCCSSGHRYFRLRSQRLAHRRGGPAARVRAADGVAGARRMAVDPAQWTHDRRRRRAACARQSRRLCAGHHARSGLDPVRGALCWARPSRGRNIQRHELGQRAASRSTRSELRSRLLAIAYGGQAVTTRVRASRGFPQTCSRIWLVVIAFAVLSTSNTTR